jgi:hypothetical protein
MVETVASVQSVNVKSAPIARAEHRNFFVGKRNIVAMWTTMQNIATGRNSFSSGF